MENFCVDSNTIFFVSQTSLSKKGDTAITGRTVRRGGGAQKEAYYLN